MKSVRYFIITVAQSFPERCVSVDTTCFDFDRARINCNDCCFSGLSKNLYTKNICLSCSYNQIRFTNDPSFFEEI